MEQWNETCHVNTMENPPCKVMWIWTLKPKMTHVFFGVKGEPKIDGSEPPFSQPNPALAFEEAFEEHMVGYEGRGLDTQIRLNNVFFQNLSACRSAGRTCAILRVLKLLQRIFGPNVLLRVWQQWRL